MKILCCGDSWTKGYGVESKDIWTSILEQTNNYTIFNEAVSGSSNFSIVKRLKEKINTNNYDVIIIGWSGSTRYHYQGHSFDFCDSDDLKLRNNFFKDKSLNDLENDFINLNYQVNELCKNKKLIKFSVFGDFKYLWDQNFTEFSFLDFLSIKQGTIFKYEIPFFEFDFLSEQNYKNTKNFAKKYFKKGWEKAIIERNEIRPSQYFLPCGHPNKEGHILWANYIKELL